MANPSRAVTVVYMEMVKDLAYNETCFVGHRAHLLIFSSVEVSTKRAFASLMRLPIRGKSMKKWQTSAFCLFLSERSHLTLQV